MFLYVSGAKGLKTKENVQSLHTWQNQSLNFQEMPEMVPGKIILKKSQQQSPRNHEITNFTLEVQNCTNGKTGPPSFINDSFSP